MKTIATVLLPFLLLCSGCDMPTVPIMDDKPVTEVEAAPVDANLVAGPYVSSVSSSQAKVCFVTDTPVSTALMVERTGFQRTIRGGEPSRFHILDLNHLSAGKRYECVILINNEERYRFPLRVYPDNDDSVRLALLCGGAADRSALAAFGEQIRESAPAATLLLGTQVQDPDVADRWYEELFTTADGPFTGTTLIHAPDLPKMSAATARDLFPAQVMDQSFVSRIGELDLIFLARADLVPSERFRLDHWLKTTLALSKARWRIVLLPPPLMTSASPSLNFHLMDAFAPLFEKHRVHLVFSSLAPFYHRSRYVGSEEHSLPYISLPQVEKVTETLPAPGELTAKQSRLPAVSFLDAAAGRLYFSTYDREGLKVDSLILDREPQPKGDRLSRQMLVDRVRADVLQRKEMRSIARQAVRAVSNPENPGSLQFFLTNPSPLPFRGMLRWESQGTGFSVTPEQLPFSLDPDAAALSIFQLTSDASGEGMPELVVLSGDRKPVRQRLLLVPQAFYELPATHRTADLDGRPGEKIWKEALALDLTSNVEGNPSPSTGARVRVIAGRDALFVTYRCPLDSAMTATQVATRRDQPVWKDESVELFIDPEGRGRRFFQFSVSIHGVTLDANMEEGTAWNPVWQQGVEVRDDRYNVELAIPYEVFGLEARPAPGTDWGMNFTRNDYSSGRCEVTQAAPTYGPNSRSGLYLRVRFR